MKTMKKTISLAALIIAAALAAGCNNDTTSSITTDGNNGGTYAAVDDIDAIDKGGDNDNSENTDNETNNDENGGTDIDTDNDGDNENGDSPDPNNDGELLLLTSTTAISDYLAEQTGGTNVDNSISLRLQIDLGGMAADSNWPKLLAALNAQGKYVNLDLSACTMSRTDFSPRSIIAAAGKDRIVSIVLPATATSIAKSTPNGGTFNSFNNLMTIILPENISSIGDNAFHSRATLTTVIIQAVTPPELGTDVFTNTNSALQIYVPSESVTAYQNAEGWNDCERSIVEMR